MKKNVFKRSLSLVVAVLMVLSCWVWFEPVETVNAANLTGDSNYLFAYFTGTSIEGQTIHLAVSQDGLNYTALRNNEPVIVPSKGTGCVRDPYIWFNEQDNYYYILATDLDFTDTGSDYSDNSESFIIWRSKDLVHWYDETMIDVKAMSHLIGDVGNMQAVWAPQVLWDGTSYVVYFSLQCNATSNGSWNPLTIVYLRTTDLLDQSAYYDYGVIHNPGRHVIDADIIKNPTTGQYYMFYKDESASGGIQSIYYMISDNGPTGPYYAPGNANSGRGPQLFSEIGKNLEGCNSFFNDNGELITFVDEYDYTNAAGQKEAHFHVCKTSDFNTFTTISDSHNINSLSPRHGSVVKITDEEYNRLLNNAYGITSSSFPASETLDDHLVGRYFTTSDYTYNAANGQNDLTLTDGTIITGQEASGEWFAGFQNAGAEINLANLIPGDLNIKDGFTITFSALVPSSTTANTRFFDISNNWSQRTDPSECYLHMSPVADSNGLYLGAYNGPVTTQSWTWASQGNNFNDDQKHEYIISFADGNMILYIDGELAMKRDRFNMNAEYGDNFLDDNWYKQIGNSKMRIGKSEWSDPLLNAYLQDFCIYDCSMSYYDVKTIQNEQDIEAGLNNSNVSSYNGFGSAYPRFEHEDSGNPTSTAHYSNMLYWQSLPNMPEGTGEDNNPDSGSYSSMAATAAQSQYTNVGIYYSNNTVLYVDGINTPKMPVMLGARLNKNSYDSAMITAYPSASASSTADNSNFYLTQNWVGFDTRANYPYAITNPQNSTIGHNSSTRLSADLDDANSQGNREIRYFANVLALNINNVTFNSNGYQKYNPSWYWEASTSGSNSSSGNASSNEGTPNHNIWVVDLRSYAAARNQIANEYDAIVKNSNYCPATIANYKAIVDILMKFNPQSYNYAGGVESAVNACSSDAKKLVDDYNKVKNALASCKTVIIPGRDATCSEPGLTQGSYCEFCGEVYESQTVTTKIPHAFGDKFQEGDNWYIKCNICGQKLLVKENEVRYENVFSFNAWYDSDSKNPNSGTIVCDFTKDKITFTNGSSDGESVSGASGNVTRSYNLYSFAVKEGKSYYLEYTLTSTDASTDIFIFYYDRDGKHVGTYGGVVSSTTGASGLYSYKFTPVENACYAELRFDSNVPGKTVEFANIGVYEEENYNNYAINNPYSRLAFNTGDSIELFTPRRKGYEFLGWYTSDGQKVENTAQLTSSVTVYAKWREIGYSVNYNGNLFSLTDFAKSDDYKMQSNAPDGHVYADFVNGTFNTVSAREGVVKANQTVAANLDTYNTPGSYKVPVTAGQEYVFTTTLANKDAYQIYLWFYNSSGGAVTHPATNAQWINHSTNNSANGAVATWNDTTLVLRFTVPANATHISFRMGTTGKYGFTQTFSDIGVYTAEDYELYSKMSNCPAMTYVPAGADVPLATPSVADWIFDSWYTGRNGSGDKFTTTVGLASNKTVFAKWQLEFNVTFDNLIDFKAWNKSAGDGDVDFITDTGFTIRSNDGKSEATSTSPIFPVEAGKSYKVDVDVTGTNWDVYVFFYGPNQTSGEGLEFSDSHNRYSSNGSGNSSRVFTAPAGAVQAAIRLDANGTKQSDDSYLSNTVGFNNIRVYEDNGISVSPVNKYVTTGDTLGTLPTPTKSGYDFAGWYDANDKQYTSSSTMDVDSTLYLKSKWTLNNTALVSDAYVLDFAVKAVFNPIENDTILLGDGSAYKLAGVSTDGSSYASSVNGTYGTFTVNGNNVEYVPTTIMNGADVAYYHVVVGNDVLVGTMYIFPATVVYYEDNVTDAVTYTDGVATSGNTGKWSETGSSKLASATQNLTDAVYGYDDVYNNSEDTFSMGSSHIVSVSKYNNPQGRYNGVADNAASWPVAEFTFAGTGFDLVSLISKNTGSIEVKVFSNTDTTAKPVYDWIVDTYYGYTIENGEWVVNPDADTSVYQIPVISNNSLAYGTYTVQIIPTYSSRLDHQKDGAYDFYLDAIRVYNPMGDDIDAVTIYLNNGEYVVAHQNIRDMLINAGSFGTSNENQVVYINPGMTEGSFEDYSLAGPKNEVYLANGQSIAFNMTVEGFKPTSVQISAHSVDGTAEMRIASGSSYTNTISISHKTTLYYSAPFTAAEYWVDNGDGTYTLKNPIVITNNGDGILSLCNIKVTSDASAAYEPMMFMMNDEDFDTAVYSVSRVADLTSDDGALFVPDEVSPETDTDVVETGEEVLVTINTSAEVYALTVNGVNATLVSVNDDGSKTWNYTFVAETRGEMTFTLVAYDAYGFASEETTVTVDVQSKIEIFFNKLSRFFKMIVEFIDKLF